MEGECGGGGGLWYIEEEENARFSSVVSTFMLIKAAKVGSRLGGFVFSLFYP